MPTPGHIRAHAGLRGLAALLVVAYHLQFGIEPRLPIEDATPFLHRCYLFVDLFFVLSGFIIAYVNDAERRRPFSRAEAGDFLLRRLIRLYPLLFFTCSYLLAYTALQSIAYLALGRTPPADWSAPSLARLAEQYLLVNAWIPGSGGWNLPSWSISAEFAAYLLFPLAVGLHARRPRLAIAVLAAAALLFYGAIASTTGSLDIIAGLAPLRCLAGFALGMLGFYSRRWWAVRTPATLGLIQIASAVWAVAVLATGANDVLAIPAFFLLVMATWTDRGPIARVLGGAGMVYLGEISYSVYLNHLCVFTVLGGAWPAFVHNVPFDHVTVRIIKIVVFYAAVLLVSHATFRFVEAPARRYLTKALAGRRAGPIAASPAAP